MFGSNLRVLAQPYPSISELSRQLGINRTQFNRYLAGESFPRPDVLARICAFFSVDARVLLEPVQSLAPVRCALTGPELGKYLGPGTTPAEQYFPSGFYRFSRRSFIAPESYIIGLVRVWRSASENCFIRGFESPEALRQQGLPESTNIREFRGLVLRLENGIGFLVSRRHAISASFNFLQPVASFENNFWNGYAARTVPESLEAERVTRLVYEHLGTGLSRALAARRNAGIVDASRLPEFHMRLLQGQTAFR